MASTTLIALASGAGLAVFGPGAARAATFGCYGWPADAGPVPQLPYPTHFFETQTWWGEGMGITDPDFAHESSHAHLGVAFPLGEAIQPVNGKLVFPMVLRLHNMEKNPGRADFVRGGFLDGTNQSGRQEGLNWNPSLADEMRLHTRLTNPVPAGQSGMKEARFTLDCASPFNGVRMYQSGRWAALVNRPAGTRQATGMTARGWYGLGVGYTNITLKTAMTSTGLATGGLPRTLSYALAQGATRTDAYIDPNIHGGSKGIVLFENRTGSSGTFTLPSLSSGDHVLLLVGKEQHAKGTNAGVLSVPFRVS